MNPIIIAAPILVLLVLGLIIGVVKSRDVTEATGRLARETVKRDTAAPLAEDADEDQRLPGKEVERLASAERRGELVAAGSGVPEVFVPLDADAIGVTRRQYLNRSIVAFFTLGLSGFGASVIAFLWPQPKGGFGSKIRVGKIADVVASVEANKGFFYVPEGRMWVVQYPKSAVDKAVKIYSKPELAGMEAGLLALFQKCPHLGCRVPSCPTSMWFECPCHGSQYNLAGEKKGGPAPRGMDRFAMTIDGGAFLVDTGTVIQGPPIGVNTTGQEAEGPHCVGGGGGH